MSVPLLGNPFQENNYYGRHITRKAPDFVLHNTQNKTVNLTNFHGKFIYLMFGYLNCVKLCHSQVLTFHALNHQLNPEDVEFVYLGMDPEQDTAEKVSLYFDARGSNFTGLIARDMLQAQNIAAVYHAYFSKEYSLQNQTYSINHPGLIYLIDPTGKLRLIYTGTNLNTDLMLSDFKLIQAEFPKPAGQST